MSGDTPERSRGRVVNDLLLGLRFALGGGRDGWTRAALTAVGVGIGVALLLLAAAVPGALRAREDRGLARSDMIFSRQVPKGDDTVLVATVDTAFRGTPVRGRVVRAEGPRAPVPPGVAALPRPGEAVVSPALKELLGSPDGRLFAPRLGGARVVGTIGHDGLSGPAELAFYLGSDTLTERGTVRLDRFGDTDSSSEGLNPLLTLLVVIIFVVLLLPIAVFVGAAVRFGGERRDRRLAALRLIGADRRMARRVAAGEAMAGALLGLLVGGLLFVAGRQVTPLVSVWDISVFADDVRPSLPLMAAIVVAVPALSVAVSLVTLRGVAIEPLGVTRRAAPPRRRLWWRLVLPALGLLTLAPLIGSGGVTSAMAQYEAAAGAILLLIGTVTLLPWLIDLVVRRLGAGPVGWQLAVRRLQLDSATSARLVNGIVVAVAGTISLQMLFGAAESQSVTATGRDVTRAQAMVSTRPGHDIAGTVARVRATPGVTWASGTLRLSLAAPSPDRSTMVYMDMRVGGCAALAEFARLGACSDGDVFLIRADAADPLLTTVFRPGAQVRTTARGSRWTLPPRSRVVPGRQGIAGPVQDAVLATPGAVRTIALDGGDIETYVRLSPHDPDAVERLRNTTAQIDPTGTTSMLSASLESPKFVNIRRGLYVGAVVTLLLIAASMLVGTLEQLRERRRLLAMLVAVGTRRSTLTWSVLWQTVVPVAIGLTLAIAFGLGLGTVLMRMTNVPVSADWPVAGWSAGLGAAVVLLVTGLSLPTLWRLTRPEGIRTE